MVLLIAIIVGVAVFCFSQGYIAFGIVCLLGFSKRFGWPALLATSAFLFWNRHWFVALLPPLLIMWNIWGLKYVGAQKIISTMKKQAASANPQDYAQAAASLRKAADQGDAVAQYNLRVLYHEGQGVPQDDTQALVWWRKAAEQGDAAAQLNLGRSYYDGRGVLQDYTQAALWWRNAAEKGDAATQFFLGGLYDSGQGVPQDYAEAYFWYALAATGEQDVSVSKQVAKYRDETASHLTPAGLAREQERARKWSEAHQAKPQ